MSENDPDADWCCSCGFYSRDTICPWCGRPTDWYWEQVEEKEFGRRSRERMFFWRTKKRRGKRAAE